MPFTEGSRDAPFATPGCVNGATATARPYTVSVGMSANPPDESTFPTSAIA